MAWVQIAIAIGYVLVLLAIMAFLHGVTLVCKDLRQRHVEQREKKECDSSLERVA